MRPMPVTLLLRATCSLVLLGYGWILSFGSPSWYTPPVTFENEFFLILGIAVLIPLFAPEKLRLARWLDALLIPAAAFIAFFSYQKWQNSGVGIGQFLKHTAQFATPLLVWFLSATGWNATLRKFTMLAVSMAFIFHGLFAIGISLPVSWLNHPTPEKFHYMVMECLAIESRTSSARILLAAGLLDLVVAVAIWLPRLRKPALLYMVAWGFLTSLARPVAYFDSSAALATLSFWIPEFLIRAPHWLLPLMLFKEASGSANSVPNNPVSEPASIPAPSRQDQP